MVTWYRRLSARVTFGGATSEPFQICRGTRQGAILSPTLANIFLSPLIEALDRSNRGALLHGHHVQVSRISVVGLTYLAKSSLSVAVSRSMHDKYVRITKPHHSAKWLQHTSSVRSYLPKSWFSDVSALVGPFCLAPPLTALSPPCVSHAQLAQHEWLQLVVSSQWERDSHRGYRVGQINWDKIRFSITDLFMGGFGSNFVRISIQ